ncbi:MAG: response regulator transcription factor [Anaerovoracaceae bacterium]
MKIFIIEDDITLKNELITLLEGYGYSCSSSDDFKNIVQVALNAQADLILLDINLPYMDGYFVCREIRKDSSVPIIIVTSRATDMDELMSMNLGADDFVTKPYNTQILLARIQAILKRSNNSMSNTLSWNDVELDLSKSSLIYQNQNVDLTRNEMRIISLLFQNPGAIITRDDLMNELWQGGDFVDDNTLTVNVNRLRKKLEQIGLSDFIKTKRGQGYIL